MITLLPCPFCGEHNPDHLVLEAEAALCWFILCRSCKSRGPEADSTYAAEEAWNQRRIVFECFQECVQRDSLI